MTFGSGSYDELSKEDFQFPEIEQLLLSGKKHQAPKIYIGLPKWGRDEWIGSLYPPKTKEREFLRYYVQHFNSIELNATHYKIQSEDTVKAWIQKIGDRGFIFCPKMYQGITHRGSLKGKQFITLMFFKQLEAFGKNLGPILIQVSDSYSTKRKQELFEFLAPLPKTYKYFLEVRHESWFSSKESFEELTDFLLHQQIGLVITDTPKEREVVHMKLTTDNAFVRFACEGDQELDKFRIQQWKKQLEEWFQNGLESCYFFLHVYNGKATPDFAKYVQTELEPLIN